MTDMTTRTGRWCSSNESWTRIVKGSGDNTYTVRFDKHHHKNRHVENDFSCTCPAYRYKGSYCKHIMQVKHECCRYGWQAAMGDPVDMGDTCPQCGGTTTVISVAT